MHASHDEEKKKNLHDLLGALGVVWRRMLFYKKAALTVFFLAGISALGNGAVPYIVGRFADSLIDAITDANSYDDSFLILAGWLLVAAFTAVVDWQINVRARTMENNIATNGIAQSFSTLLLLPISFHKGNMAGETGNKISRAIHYMAQIVSNVILGIGPAILSMVVGLVFAMYIQPTLALVIVFGMFCYGAISAWSVMPLADFQKKDHKAWNEAYGHAYDAVGNAHAVKQASGEKAASRKIYIEFIEKVLPLSLKPELIWARISFFQRSAVVLTQFSVFLLSIRFVALGEITVGDLIALNGYAAMVFAPLAQLASQWNVIQNGLTAIVGAEEILSIPPERYELEAGMEEPAEWRGEIVFQNVSFIYPETTRTVLDGVSFSIQDGETVAFVGESGVGKTTITELISGYYYPTTGSILMSGVSTTKLPLRPLRERIAVVAQEPVLFNDTILTNIRFGRPDATDEEVVSAAKQAHAHDFIDSFEKKYDQLVGERGVKLSVGQKQRVSIARAILRNPRILILDEPTSALDAKTESLISESLEKLMQGRTTIIIAHRLSTVRKADNIIVFDGGKVVEQGKHLDLIKNENGVYRRLYEYQIGLHV
ncbi:MAG: ABC transporter ATP-binding protein [Patescibacteria group bacterium]